MESSRSSHLDGYAIRDVERIAGPRLLVFRSWLERNIGSMWRHLEAITPGSGFRHLCPHVKTHKSTWVTRLLMESGVEHFKCSLNELDMLLEAGARSIFVAYPLLPADAEAVVSRIAAHPERRVTLQIGSLPHAAALAAAAARRGVELDCLIDVDVGNHRTGIDPSAAHDLARRVLATPDLGALRLRGIHAYDGHNSSVDEKERQACAAQAMEAVVRCLREVGAAGVRTERVVVGGTPGFLPDLEELLGRHHLDCEVHVSPGTWIYWDTNYERKAPGLFAYAALVLARVMDLPGDDLLTLNLGYKRWAIDHGPIELFSLQGLEFVSATEEHTVLRAVAGPRPPLGTPILLAPRHVCPTVNLWDSFTLIGADGSIEEESLPVNARNR